MYFKILIKVGKSYLTHVCAKSNFLTVFQNSQRLRYLMFSGIPDYFIHPFFISFLPYIFSLTLNTCQSTCRIHLTLIFLKKHLQLGFMCMPSLEKHYSNELIFHQSILRDNRHSNSWKSFTHVQTGNLSAPTIVHKIQSFILFLGLWLPFHLFQQISYSHYLIFSPLLFNFSLFFTVMI